MLEPELPADETQRLRDLESLGILDTDPEPRFDRITRVAQRLFDVPIALVTLVDRDRQWFKSRQGLGARETPRSISFCGHAILRDGLFVVSDAREDTRFADNPLVTDHPSIRFYAGAPLHAASGRRMGTLCIIDRVPRTLSAGDCRALQDLGDWAEEELANIELAEAVAALRAEMASKRDFVSMIAHEVRTPATVVRAALGMISADRELADRAAELNIIAMANRNAERLSTLLDNFFELERLDQGVVELRSEPQPLKPLVEHALDLESSRAQAAKVTLTLQWRAPEQLSVPVDASRLEQVLSNLIANAVQHSSVGQSVEVSAQVVDSRARLAVRDYGPGIPAWFRPRLFQRFAQADMSDSRPKGGVGLGLALSKEYVELMGGSIDVDCPTEGGTIFSIELPAAGSG